MADLRRLNKTMPQILQWAIQQELERQRQEGWLQKTLREYGAWGEQQEKLQQSGLKKEALLMLLELMAKGVEKSDRPGLKMLEMLPQLGITKEAYPELGLPTPTISYEEAMDPYEEATKMVMQSYEGLSYPEAQAIAKMVMTKGSDFTSELIKDVAKLKKEEEERGLRKEEIGEAVKGRKLREEELGVRRAELVAKEKGEPKTSTLETRLESKRQERWTLAEKILRPEESVTSKQVDNWKKQVEALNDDIKRIKKKLGYDTPETDPDAKHAAAAKILRSQGYKKQDLFDNKNAIAWINENNLSVWVLLEYF